MQQTDGKNHITCTRRQIFKVSLQTSVIFALEYFWPWSLGRIVLHVWNVWLSVHTVFWHWQWTHRSKTSLGLPLHSDHGQQTTWRQLEDARSLCSSGRTSGPTGGEAPPGHGCPSSCLRLPRLPRRSPATAAGEKGRPWDFVAWGSSAPAGLGAAGTLISLAAP